MFEYFKLIEETANACTENFDSIKDLTLTIAKRAGYHRVKEKNESGVLRTRTFYTQPFDSGLVAKWYMFYRSLFVGKLRKIEFLEEYFTDIIYKTFLSCMQSLQIDRIVTDSSIHSLVNISLNQRIYDALYFRGNKAGLDEYMDKKVNKDTTKKSRNKIKVKDIANLLSIPIDSITEDIINSNMSENTFDLINLKVDVGKRINNDKIGMRLLDAMLFCNKKIQPSHIDDFVPLLAEECTEDTKHKLLSAWNIIEDVLREYLHSSHIPNVYKWHKVNKINYSFENIKSK